MESRSTDRIPGAPAPTAARDRLATRTRRVTAFRVVEVMERAWEVEAAGRPVVHLVAGEPDFGTPRPVVEAAARAMASGHVHYTAALGMPALREAISGYYAERLGVQVPPHRIVVTTGASGALLLAFGATVDPGDEVLMTDPGYPCNANMLRAYGGVPTGVPTGPEHNYQLTAARVAELWSDSTRGALVGTPSNPTGTIVEPGELAAIGSEVSARGGVYFVDEVYGELVYDRRPSTVLAATDDAFVVGSFSKTFGMTGWRLGWLVCPDWALDAVTRLTQNLYISPPTPAQLAGIAAFQPAVWDIVEERRQEFATRREVIVAGLRDIGFGVPVTPQGGFYVYAQCDAFCEDSSQFVHRLLDGAGVAVTPGDDFGTYRADRHVRVSYTTSLDRIREGLARLSAFLAR